MFKKMTFLALAAFLVLIFAAMPASAHSLMMMSGDNLTDACEADIHNYLINPGVQSIVIVGGHGYEYDFEDTPDMLTVTITAPDGTTKSVATTTVTENFTNILSGGKYVLNYQQVNVTFDQKGIYYLSTSMDETTTTNNTTTTTTQLSKMMIFVGSGTWDGWSRDLGLPLEFVPYTRVGGLATGEALYGKVVANGAGVSNITFYGEPVNNATAAKAAYDEIKQTYPEIGEDIYLVYSKRAYTDGSGDFVSTPNAPGVWMYVAESNKTADGHSFKTTFTVPVLDQLSTSTATTTADGTKTVPGFELVIGVLAVLGVGLFLYKRK
ncbi:hypothetical protein MsAg5_06430 [Methanosarcinaceae archaeon Ag5]|uniref:PGF-CTERM archaeal protein-sorting signal domain-containing protein n=1 Tax=Methanolapillus africanus TaxID=3028297 RepID=A0AAE4MHP2_9EURY|nr:hypothetical protein [Methanosarcinaceae archaeon Ag5]